MSWWADKSVVVTGGHGFLGSYIVDLLRATDARLVISLGRKECDLRSQRETSVFFDFYGTPDIVIHSAATVGGIGANQARPGAFFYDNAIMGINLIEESRKRGVKKFVCVGTTCSYPKITKMPFNEDDFWEGYPEPTAAPYGISKKALLVQLQAYRQEYGFNGIYLVPTNLYGPRDKFHPENSHVIPGLIQNFISRRDSGFSWAPVWGTGNATRDFVYVEDAAEAIVKATELYDGEGPLNIGSGRTISIRELADILKDLIGFKGELVWDTNKPDGQPKRVLDIRRVYAEIGWKPKTDFVEGLKRTIAWYEESRGDNYDL